jgi:lambda family phage tail tape measure protein
MWPWLKLVGEGLLVYFVAKTVRGAIGDIAHHFNLVTTRFKAAAVAQQQLVRDYAAAQAENSLIDARRLQQVASSDIELLAKKRVLYAELQRQHASYLHGIQVMENLYRVNAAGKMIDDKGRFVPASVVNANNAYIAQYERQRRAIERTMEAEGKALRQLDGGIIATRQAAQEKLNLANAASAGATQLGLLARAATIGRTALALVGGPIGLITLALTIGIPLWLQYANSAEKAMKRVRDAVNNKTGTYEDLDEIDKQLAERRASLAFHEQQIKRHEDTRRMAPGTPVNEEERELRAMAEKERQEIADLEQAKLRIREDAQQRDIELRVEGVARAASREQQARMSAVNDQIARDRAETEERLKGMKGNQTLIEKEIAAFNDRAAIARAKFAQEEVERLIKERTEIQKRLADTDRNDTVNRGVLGRMLDMKNQELAAAEIFADRAERFKDKMTTRVKPQKDPLVSALEKAKGDLAESRAKLNDLEDGVMEYQRIYEGVLAGLMHDAVAGRFDRRDGKGGKIPFLNEAGEIARAEDKLKLEQLAANLAKIEETNRARQVATQLMRLQTSETDRERDAMERLANAGEKSGTEFARVTRQLDVLASRLSESQMKEFLNGESFENFKKRIQGLSAGTDFGNFVGDLMQQNAKLRTSVIVNERKRREAEYQEEIAHLARMWQARKENLLKTKGDNDETRAQIALGEAEFYEHMKLLAEKHVYEMRTPLEQLRDSWLDVTGQMENAGVKWANSMVDAIMNFARTGRFEFNKFLLGILEDILRMKIQQTLAIPMQQGLDYLGRAVVGLFGTASATPLADAAAAGGIISPNANGGIMTPGGPMDLRRYAAGGIAKSPQLALFGEGSMHEAFVPLPDGRSIPVTMQGNPGSVTVNVINQSGTPVKAEQGATRFDGKQLILDVVLTAAHQPGPFREGLKSAVRS